MLDWSTRKIRKLTNEQQPGFSWGVVAWSSEGKTIYANRMNPAITDQDIYRIDVASGRVKNLTSHKGLDRFRLDD